MDLERSPDRGVAVNTEGRASLRGLQVESGWLDSFKTALGGLDPDALELVLRRACDAGQGHLACGVSRPIMVSSSADEDTP